MNKTTLMEGLEMKKYLKNSNKDGPSDYDEIGWDITGKPNTSPLRWIVFLLAVVLILAMCYRPGPVLTGKKSQSQVVSQDCKNDCGRW